MTKTAEQYLRHLKRSQNRLLKINASLEMRILEVKNAAGICQGDYCMNPVESKKTDFCPSCHAEIERDIKEANEIFVR